MQSFFEELGEIERYGMLSKVAFNPMGVANLARTSWKMVRSPVQAGTMLQALFRRGMVGLPQEAGLGQRIGAGVKSLWGRPEGRAALIGAGGAVGAGGLGTAFMAGRGSR